MELVNLVLESFAAPSEKQCLGLLMAVWGSARVCLGFFEDSLRISSRVHCSGCDKLALFGKNGVFVFYIILFLYFL